MRRLVVSSFVLALSLAGLGAAQVGPAEELLPDLDQRVPHDLEIQTVFRDGRPRFRLGFTSAVDNIGLGPLVIRARRESPAEPFMVANQAVLLSNGRMRKYRDVGVVRYVDAETHSHWHFLPFERYELRRADDFALVVRDRKTGFCFSDRHEIEPGVRAPGKPRAAVYTTFCGPGQPDRLRVEEGASVGYRDIYPAHLEGQYLDVTDVAAGTYVLVHRVNAARRLHELDYENNAASLLVRLTWPNGRSRVPGIQVLSECERRANCAEGRVLHGVMLLGR